jgi:DNA-binding GntR family transcriptional regulator
MTAGRVPTQDIEVVTVAADTGLAGRMGIPQGTLLTSRRLRRYADGDLDNLITFWYLADIARGTPLEDPADITEGAVAWLEERHPLAHEALIELHLAGQPLAVEACRAMGVPPSPLLVVWRVGRDRAGTVLVASRAIYPPGTKLRIEGP